MKQKKLEKGIQIRMSVEEYARVSKMAEKEDRTLSNYVRKVLRGQHEESWKELLEACKKVLELAKDTQFLEHPTMEFVAAAVKRAEGE